MLDLLIKIVHEQPWLAASVPWILVTYFLLRRALTREDKTLEAFRSGMDSQSHSSAAIQSLERSVGTQQATLDTLAQRVEELVRKADSIEQKLDGLTRTGNRLHDN